MSEKHLYGSEAMPAAVVRDGRMELAECDEPTPSGLLSALNFARRSSRIGFGMSAQSTAKTLRQMADRVERGDLLIQRATVETTADSDDFTLTRVTLDVVERDSE